MPHFPDGRRHGRDPDGLMTLPARKVLYGGLSNFPAWRVAGAAVRADLRNLTPVAVSRRIQLGDRSAERNCYRWPRPWIGRHVVLPTRWRAAHRQVPTGRERQAECSWRRGGEFRTADSRGRRVLAIADGISSSAAQVSLAWLRHRASLAPTALIPIAGPRSLTQLRNTCSLSNSSSMTRTIDIWMRSVRSSWAPTSGRYCGSEPRLRRDRSLLDTSPCP